MHTASSERHALWCAYQSGFSCNTVCVRSGAQSRDGSCYLHKRLQNKLVSEREVRSQALTCTATFSQIPSHEKAHKYTAVHLGLRWWWCVVGTSRTLTHLRRAGGSRAEWTARPAWRSTRWRAPGPTQCGSGSSSPTSGRGCPGSSYGPWPPHRPCGGTAGPTWHRGKEENSDRWRTLQKAKYKSTKKSYKEKKKSRLRKIFFFFFFFRGPLIIYSFSISCTVPELAMG